MITQDNYERKKNEVGGYRLIVGYLGITMIFVGIFCLIPLVLLSFYPNEISEAKYFIIPGVLSMFFGYLGSLFIKNEAVKKLERHQDAVLVVLVWMMSIIISAVPFWLHPKYNLIQSLFEATSGFTTTGLSVVDVSTTSHLFLFYRSLLLFLGGVGIILVVTSVLSDRYGMRLYNAEGHNDRLIPNLVKSSRLILSIYLGYIAVGTLLFVIFKMPLFDAINHSIASVSTGGFSTQVDSIGTYQSLPIEIITIILMILGSTNFFVHLYMIRGKFSNIIRHSEIKFLGLLFLLIVPIMYLSIPNEEYSVGERIRMTVFQFFSSVTTTGFQTVETFTTMSTLFLVFVVLLMLIGAGIGSTGGGIKQQRVLLAFKSIFWTLRDHLSNKRIIRTNSIEKVGNQVSIDPSEQIDNFSFISLYILIFIIGTSVFVAYGNSLMDSMFEFASSLGTVGLSVGITGYNAPNGVLLMSMIGMFLGRMEIYVVIYALVKFPGSMKKRVKEHESILN